MKTINKDLNLEIKTVDKDLNLEIKMSTHGFEKSTHEYSRQRFESENKGVDT